MATIEIRDLLDKETGEQVFPRTHVKAVIGLSDSTFFEEYTEENGSKSVRLRPDYIGLWADGFISSGDDGGAEPSPTPTPGVSEIPQMWDTLRNTAQDTTYNNYQIHPLHLTDALTGYARLTDVDSRINALVDNAPSNLNTLGELATAVTANASSISGIQSVINRLSAVATSGNYADLINKPDLTAFAIIGEEISQATQDLPAVVQLEDASGDPIEPYCPNLEEWIGEKANLNGDMTQNFSVKSLRFRTNPMNGKYSGLSYNTTSKRLVLTDTYNTHIVSEPLAFQSDLSAYAPLTSLSDYVTLATAQTISGAKTFSSELLAGGGLRATSYIYPSADNSVFLGASSLRWAAINTKTIGANRYYLSEDNTTGDNYGSISGGGATGEHYAALTVGEKTYMFNEAYGLFFQGGGVVLGRSDHRWSNVYSVNGNFSGALSVTGLTTASGGVRTNSLTHVSDYDLVIGNPGNSNLILIREDMQSYDTETIEDEEYPYWTIFEDGRALFKSVSINNSTASITSDGYAKVTRLYLDANTYIYKDGNAWHLKSSVSGGSVNLIVDGDISCAG